ncbi:MAG: type II secretion system F family protein [Myxococcota bacterium]
MSALLGTAVACTVLGISGVAYALGSRVAAPAPQRLGMRGLKRARALENGWFRAVEPSVRLVGTWMAALPVDRLRGEVEVRLEASGYYLGLTANEVIAISIAFASASGSTWLLLSTFAGWPPGPALPVAAACSALPYAYLRGEVRRRARRIERRLPAAIDLAALCMSAGLDFPGSLRQIVQSAPDPQEPLIEEIRAVLRELDLGYSRARAIRGFARRVGSDAVSEFVNSVVQAEDKGNPLADVLAVQARTQRLRQSFRAEENASGAALMLVGPMTLIFVCVIALVLSPLVIRFISGEFQVF